MYFNVSSSLSALSDLYEFSVNWSVEQLYLFLLQLSKLLLWPVSTSIVKQHWQSENKSRDFEAEQIRDELFHLSWLANE